MKEKEDLELHNCEDCCDDNCDHEHDGFGTFSVTDEDGVEHHFEIVYEFESEGNIYWVTEEFSEDEEESELEEDDSAYVLFRVEYDGENGDPFLYSVEDDEFEKASAVWNRIVEEMIASGDIEEDE